MTTEGWLIIAWNALVMTCYTVWELKRPRIPREDIIYRETWRCGLRLTSLWTRLGNAQNCLMVLFLADKMVVRGHYPFNEIALFFGMDFAVPYHSITAVSCKKFFLMGKYVRITFRRDNREDAVMFTCRDYEKTLAVLRERCDSNVYFD